MIEHAPAPSARGARPGWLAGIRAGRFLKIVYLFLAVVCVALISNGASESWFSYQEHKIVLARIQHEQAQAAAARIKDFIDEIQDQLDLTTHTPWNAIPPGPQQLELWRLILHRVPAISEVSLLDANGREQIRVSRTELDRVGSQIDFSKQPYFTEAVANKVYYSPVYFWRGSEPYMTIAVTAPRPGLGVTVAEVNLKFIRDVVSQIKVGEHGTAYVVSARGRLIAHTNMGLVLRHMDLSHLEQIRAARTQPTMSVGHVLEVEDIQGRPVLAHYAPIVPPGWLMVTELPQDEARAPLYAALERSGLSLLLGLGLALAAGLFLAYRIMAPIRKLREGAAQISLGNLDHRVTVKTGDELEDLADQFNHMAARLQESHLDLESKIEARTQELMAASQRIASQEALSSTQSTLARITRLITVGEMAASIAHEINQPLAGIVANANAGLRWLGSTTPNLDEARAAFKQIVGAGHHAGDVIGSIRALFRKSGQQKSPVEINELIREVLDLVQGELRKHGVSVQTELNGGLPPVTGDRVQLQQVILNLILNAIDAMASVTDRAHVLRITSEVGADKAVLVSVADSGTGIDAKDGDRIFDSFFTTKPEGTGMGLSICRSVIQAHKGRIWASAGVPYGSEFRFLLPTGEAGDPA